MSHSLLFSFKATLNNTSHHSITLEWKKTSSSLVRMWILPDKFNGFGFGLVWFSDTGSVPLPASRPLGILPSECPSSVKILIILLYRG